MYSASSLCVHAIPCRHAFLRTFYAFLLFYSSAGVAEHIDSHWPCSVHAIQLHLFLGPSTHFFFQMEIGMNNKRKKNITANHSTYHLCCLIYSSEVINKIPCSESSHKHTHTNGSYNLHSVNQCVSEHIRGGLAHCASFRLASNPNVHVYEHLSHFL